MSIDLIPEEKGDEWWLQGPSKLYFTKGETSFVIEIERFYLGGFNMLPYKVRAIHDTTLFLEYIYPPHRHLIDDSNPFYFADIDYDGDDELVLVRKLMGPRGSTWYQVFELDGTERLDRPIGCIDSQTIFDRKTGTITLHYYYGQIIGSVLLQFKHQRDGRFSLIDSTEVVDGVMLRQSVQNVADL